MVKEAVRNRPLVRKAVWLTACFRVTPRKIVWVSVNCLQELEAIGCCLLQKVERELSLYCVMLSVGTFSLGVLD